MDLQTMVLTETASKAILALVFAYLYAIRRERFLGAWTIGWAALVAFNTTLMLFPPESSAGLAIGDLAMLASAAAFLWGTHALHGQSVHGGWWVAFWAGTCWVAITPLLSLTFTAQSLPLSVLLGVALIHVGWNLIRWPGTHALEGALPGFAILLWGVHVLDYPFLGRDPQFAPYGFFLSFLLQLTAAVGMLLLYVRRYHEQLRSSEAALARARQTDAMGRLAGGIAHDFNNALTVIMGSLDAMTPGEHDRRARADAAAAAQRASDLTRQLLAYARQQPSQPRRVNLAATLHDAGRLLERIIGSSIHLQVIADLPVHIDIDPVHLDQIIMNLAINGRDAMPEGGQLTLSSSRRRLDTPLEWIGGRLPPGEYVELGVTDTGHGIPESVLPNLFEPFFSTKPEGEGSGLGLATVLGLVIEARAAIRVDSTEAAGASFRVLFPHAASDQASADVGAEAAAGR